MTFKDKTCEKCCFRVGDECRRFPPPTIVKEYSHFSSACAEYAESLEKLAIGNQESKEDWNKVIDDASKNSQHAKAKKLPFHVVDKASMARRLQHIFDTDPDSIPASPHHVIELIGKLKQQFFDAVQDDELAKYIYKLPRKELDELANNAWNG